ncbi:MAG TPA: thioredoxin domain-containing protein [Bryobacteraceae bacterium]|nr:thioredoxin domain-containing protein [Bryobacteraceae bacterium]
MPTNRLAKEQSPYLLQHAHNPVDWYPWGAEAFEKARRENKPIFLSIGYSTCHWCHVMERESFETDSIAELLNRDYVPIKVDREERPDVDRIYMHFVQATTGSGGWPMSVWLTPELQPFFGGTYFPPENRWGHPGFASILTQISSAWGTDRERIVDSARDVVEQLRKQAAVEPGRTSSIDTSTANSGFAIFRRTFDPQLGGFGGAPKFPRPAVFNFLLRYHARTRNREALDMVLLTLREMAKGGMHDQLGGGFHRYSVDERWFVPHFEKMLYDQAQLAISYLEAFQITHEAQYAETARGIFDYVLRDMTDTAGGFYSAEDADSVIDPEEPGVKGEGAFYIWTAEEIRELVGQPVAEWFCHCYGVADGGNVANDPHHEFTRRNILYRAATIEETAEQFGRTVDEVRIGVREAERTLLAARSKRVRPHLDDKVLTAWNGLMISAFALGGVVLDEPRYAEAARRAAAFVIQTMYDAGTGQLLRRYRKGDAAIPAFLDDYAMFSQALLDLYEAQFDLRHLEIAIRLTEKQIEVFEDGTQGGFFSSAADDASLVMRMKEDYDGAEPSGNSVAVMNLLRLAQMTNRDGFRRSAERALAAFAPRLSVAPVALPQMLVACEFFLGEPRQIILAGERESADTRELVRTLYSHFVPARVILLVDSDTTRRTLAAGIPTIASMQKVDGRASAYVCRNYTCQLPVSEPGKFAELIQY